MVESAAKPQRSAIRRGHAFLEVAMVSGQSTVTSAWSSEPLRLLTPKSRGASVWAYSSSFGGGMVRGDQTRLDVAVGPDARCFISTQATTKIYRNPSQLPCSHATRADLARGSLLVFVPEPIQVFAGASYAQRQEFFLAPDSGLVLLDWFNSGRAARGERWEFSRFRSRNEVFIAGEKVFLDSIVLESIESSLTSPMRMGRFNCFAVLLLIGEPLRAAAAASVNAISAAPIEPRSSLLAAASPVRDGAVLRWAGEEPESVARSIRGHLACLAGMLGDDPWNRKW